MRSQLCVENNPGWKLTKAVQCQSSKGICRESLSQLVNDLFVLVTVKFEAKLKKMFFKNIFVSPKYLEKFQHFLTLPEPSQTKQQVSTK